jgi:nucleoside-diphosphate kinase
MSDELMIQQTLVLIKPDGVKRGLIGEIIRRFERRGLKIVALKMTQPQRNLAEKHYNESISQKHGEAVRNRLLDYITGGPVVAMIIQGINAIALVRKIVGSTYPGEAEIGTIRGDFAHATKDYVKTKQQGSNLIHASENENDAAMELGLWFAIDEVFDYKISAEEFLF